MKRSTYQYLIQALRDKKNAPLQIRGALFKEIPLQEGEEPTLHFCATGLMQAVTIGAPDNPAESERGFLSPNTLKRIGVSKNEDDFIRVLNDDSFNFKQISAILEAAVVSRLIILENE